jgi:thiol-disulfide isomerase/thioredoxin
MAWVLQKYNWANLPDFHVYLNKFYDICSEESFLSYIVDKVDTTQFNYPQNILETELTKKDGSKISWQQILDKYQGKVVLIDLWASWCGPCYTALPYLKKLKEQYGENGFEVIALSIEDNKREWKSGLRKYKKAYPNNEQYLIGSKRFSKGGLIQFLLTRRENEKIQFGVPRYVLLDQKGKNVISEAPRPNTDQIHKVLRAFLPKNAK